MSNSISWIHLTDLHWGQGNEWLWPGMRQQFFADLKQMAEKTGPWDVVFFTGDFVQNGDSKQFRELATQMEKLWAHFRELGSEPLLLCVPGNHDLRRPGQTEPITRQSSRWHDTSEECVRDEFWNDAKSHYRKAVVKSLKNFTTWQKSIQIPQPKINRGLLPGDFSVELERNKTILGVVGLNSAFLQLGSGDYEGRLDLHVRQLHAVCNKDPQAWRERVDLAVLLTHHPRTWLHLQAKEQLSEIYSLGKFDIHLAGHLHDPAMHDVSEAGGPVRRTRQGASLFGLEKFGSSQTRPCFGYTLGRWEINGTEAKEILWPRRDYPIYGGGRRLAPDSGFELIDNVRLENVFKIQSANRTHCVSKSIQSLPDARVPTELSSVGQEQRLIHPEKPVDAQAAALKLKNLPRVRMRSEDHHRAIREEGYQRMARILRERYTAWLVCDWGLGKSGFLACALDEYAGTDFRDIFLLECGDAKNCAEMQELSETQFGVSFQEFCAAISVIPDAVLIFDDLPSALATGDERSSVQSKLIDAMHSFCPNLRMVFIVRQEPSETDPEAIVILRPLEIGETRKYLKMHPRIQSGLDDPDTLERIQSWSDGLPMNLDHLLEQLQVFSLSEILNEGGNPSADRASLSEPIPRALREAVAQLAEAQTERGHQSFRLLKVLTVLRDGEVFQAIKRFYPKEPFYRNNVSELISLGLLEAIPISQTAAELSPRAGRIAKLNADDLKLLRVPPQVRNYMREFITQNEADVILRDSTELLFGKDWRSGQVRLRTALDDSYSHSTISGPGNERVIVQYLIQEALNGGDEHQTKRAILIGLCLCDKLLTLDRFRDAVIASGMMYHLLKNTEFSEDIAESARMSARALRMMDFDQNAIEMSKIALEKGATTYSGVVKASIHLNIAMAHEGLEQKDDALAEAEEVLKLARKESSEWYQAESIIAKFTIEDPTEREQRLRYLLGRARKGGFDMAANNIVFDLLRRQEDAEASLKELESVFKTAKGNYTRARAIIKKSALLAKLGRIGDLTNKDRELLSAAYNYSYAQRIGNLLDRCHKVLWDVFSIEGIAAGMLRLFRLSCFFWTLKGAKDRISQYVRKLDNIDLEELKRAEGRTLDPEILYLQQRRQEYIDTEDDLGREQM